MVGSATGQKHTVKFLQNMVYTAQFTPAPSSPTQTHNVCINCTFSLGRGEEVREKIERQQYEYTSSFVHWANSSQAGPKIPTNE